MLSRIASVAILLQNGTYITCAIFSNSKLQPDGSPCYLESATDEERRDSKRKRERARVGKMGLARGERLQRTYTQYRGRFFFWWGCVNVSLRAPLTLTNERVGQPSAGHATVGCSESVSVCVCKVFVNFVISIHFAQSLSLRLPLLLLVMLMLLLVVKAMLVSRVGSATSLLVAFSPHWQRRISSAVGLINARRG